MPDEAGLEESIRAATAKIEELRAERDELRSKLEESGGLRRLLYEKGHQLEAAIVEALGLMGFSASGHQNAESEFDAVFVGPEGRFLAGPNYRICAIVLRPAQSHDLDR